MIHVGSLVASFHWVMRMVWNIVELLEVPTVWKGNENFVNTTNFAKNTAIKKAAENKHMALWHAGVIKKANSKRGRV